jgi:uncharacterized membrane protein
VIQFLRRYFLFGLLAITPLAITVWILWRFYDFISANMRPWMQRIPGLENNYPEFFLTLIGVVVFVLVITVIGMFARNIIGVAFFRLVERFIDKIPVVKSVFSATKQISQVFLGDRRSAFKRAVLFQYPREGLFSLAFVTRDEPDEDLVNVFLPTTPNPTSGFLLMVPRGDLMELPLTVEEAIKLIISGGSIMTAEQAQVSQGLVRDLADRDAKSPQLNQGPETGKDVTS